MCGVYMVPNYQGGYLRYLWYLITGGAIEKMYKEDKKIIRIVERGSMEQKAVERYEW